MDKGLDRPNVIPWPPIILLTCLAVGLWLGYRYPLTWPDTIGGQVLGGLGFVLIVIAAILYATAFMAMRKARTTILPHRGASKLVTNGPFAFSRNPIYVANVILLLGVGLLQSSIWMFVIAGINGIAEHFLAILPEERHLDRRFGKQWRDYKRVVRRWI